MITFNNKFHFNIVSDPLGMPILRSNISLELKQRSKSYEGALYKKQVKEVEF